MKEAKADRRIEALAPKPEERLASERVMSSASFGAESAGAAQQLGLALRLSPYSRLFEHAPDRPFFRIDRHDGGRALVINTAHRFYDEIYDGPASTPEMRTALEIMLFCELALAMLAEHLARGEEEDVEAMLYDPILDKRMAVRFAIRYAGRMCGPRDSRGHIVWRTMTSMGLVDYAHSRPS